MSSTAFQDLIPDNGCYGCGPANPHGLRIKSVWEGEEAVCVYRPEPHQSAGPPQFLNGGIIATLIDCHSVCTAIAHAYRAEGRPIGSAPHIWCVTANLNVTYLRPTPLEAAGDAARPHRRGRPEEDARALQPLLELGRVRPRGGGGREGAGQLAGVSGKPAPKRRLRARYGFPAVGMKTIRVD